MDEAAFARYSKRVSDALDRCKCDADFLGETCETCVAIMKKYTAESKRHYEERKAKQP